MFGAADRRRVLAAAGSLQVHRRYGIEPPMTRSLFAFIALAIAVLPASTRADEVQAGQALALDRGKGNCLACHTIKGGDVPSSVGRELVGMKRRFPNRADLVEILTDESMRNPIAPMPSFGRNHILTRPEIEKIIDFLYTL
jgi:sulfur-oxidizing protein SoxX